jgi:general secretion pathway protein D
VQFAGQAFWRNISHYFMAGALIVVLSGCATRNDLAGLGPHDEVDAIRNADLAARFQATTAQGSSRPATTPRAQIFPGLDFLPRGSGNRSASGAPAQAALRSGSEGTLTTADGVEVNFENADIHLVAKSILSDTLGLDVVIDPRVQGTVTIVSASPIPRKNLFSAFEGVMRMSNAAVVREGSLIKIIPLSEAAGAGPVTLGPGPGGFGVTVIPLRYTSAVSVAKVAENFLVRPGAVRADASQNFLMIQGTAAERQSAVDMVSSFDVEWLRDQSVGIFPLKSTSPDTMIAELNHLFQTADGAQGQGMISFQPITRMNAVMAVAHNRRYLEQASQWVRRLDRSEASGATIRVYRLSNGDAQKIAKILKGIFVSRGGSTGESASSQLAPGTQATHTQLGSVNTGSSFSNSQSTSNNSTSSSSQSASGLQSSTTGSKANSFDDFSSKKEGGSDSGASGSLPKGVFENVRITADTGNNSLIIYSNEDDYRIIERSIRDLDKPQMQVAIEATIAEVTLTDDLQYGVQYYLSNNTGSVSLSTSSSSTLSETNPGMNIVLGSQSSPHVVLSALSSLTSVKVLSSPELVVTDNQPAFLQVGDSVPISTGSATVLSSSNTVVNTTTYQDTGVILKVWPHIHANGTVQMEIEQEVSSVPDSSTTNLNPTISQRRIHSTIAMESGQTVLLGGLMSENTTKTQTGIPILRRIQGLGDLFGSTDGSKTRTEIIVFVKPTIVRNGVDAQEVAEEFRSKLSTMHQENEIVSGRGVHTKGTFEMITQ